MNLRFFYFIAIFYFLFQGIDLPAQTSANGIAYDYDDGGNRIKRYFSSTSSRLANPAYDESKSQQVDSNTLQNELPNSENKNPFKIEITVNPNPSTSGKFIGLVQKKEFNVSDLKNEKDAHSASATVSIYNPLGDLIMHQNINYDQQINFNLTSLSKGVYVIMVRDGNELEFQRIIYQ